MKNILKFFAPVVLLVACSSNTPLTPNDSYSLDWKIDSNEKVAYKTAMNQIEDSAVSFNLDQIFSDNPNFDQLSEQVSGFALPESGSLISILELNAHGNISVRMIVDQLNFDESQSENEFGQSLNQLMKSMEGTVQLRGEITPDGAISSFYLEERQRNLLAIFFELPTTPVRVGDTWSIDFNCISMGAGFIADTAQKVNQVRLASLSQTPDGKPVAVLDYVLGEMVEGDFQSLSSGEPTLTSMTCSFVGQGHFLIDEGRWAKFVGEFAIRSTGIIESNAVQRFALMPLEEIPEKYRE